MKNFYIALCFLTVICSYAQDSLTFRSRYIETAPDVNHVYKITEVDKIPEFTGGTEAFFKQFKKEFSMPGTLRSTENVLLVSLRFTIEKDGRISEPDATVFDQKSNVRSSLIAELNRALLAMPKWTPAEKDGRRVRVKQIIAYKIVVRKYDNSMARPALREGGTN